MEMFLVRGQIHISEYMVDGKRVIDELRLVKANDPSDAERRFREYFESKTSDYSVYYSVYNVEVLETIS